MPLYDLTCANGHTHEVLRSYMTRDDPTPCKTCGEPTKRLVALPHCVPDGMYSYAPNVGDPNAFERRLEAQKNGQKVINKSAPEPGAKFYG